MVHHWLGVGSITAAVILTTLGAVLTLGATGLFVGALLFAAAGAVLVDRDRFGE